MRGMRKMSPSTLFWVCIAGAFVVAESQEVCKREHQRDMQRSHETKLGASFIQKMTSSGTTFVNQAFLNDWNETPSGQSTADGAEDKEKSQCEDHPGCKNQGLVGACCPNLEGTRLACCDENIEPTASTAPVIHAADGDVNRLLEEIADLKRLMSSMERGDSFCCNKSHSCDSSTSRSPNNEPMLCAAFGDPHYITFDGAQTTYVGDMIQWMVKSNTVWLQALSRGSKGKFLGFAVGGPFLSGHKLVVHNASAGEPLRVTLDDQPILRDDNSEFRNEILEAYRRKDWDGTIFNDNVLNARTHMKFGIDKGTFQKRFLTLPEFGVYMFKLPGGVEVTLSGVDFMSTVVSMVAQEGGQSGYCGNFNGNPDDDAEPVSPSWDKPIGKDLDPVPEDMVIFPKDIAASFLEKTLTLDPKSQESTLATYTKQVDKCLPELLQKAEVACTDLRAVYHKFCIFDVCLTGDIAVAGTTRAAEIMEQKLNARGVPIFMGHGQCLDSQARSYQSFSTKLRTDSGCKQLLRTLALTEGVVGAQLQRGSNCEILVTRGADPATTGIPGGWNLPAWSNITLSRDASMIALRDSASPTEKQTSEDFEQLGEGPVVDTTVDAAWDCWQLD